jgi:uncharacterized protein YhfF
MIKFCAFLEKLMTIEQFWDAFLQEAGLPASRTYLESFHFHFNEKWANELLRLVLIGQKQATSSSLWAYELSGERIPQVGDYSIVTDWEGNPRCVIQTTAITIIPFKEMTFEICKREGEDDTLESWRAGHIQFFISDGKDVGYTFTEDMPIIFEDFQVVFQG